MIVGNASGDVLLYHNIGTGEASGFDAGQAVLTHTGTNKFIVVEPPTTSRFYRLHKP